MRGMNSDRLRRTLIQAARCERLPGGVPEGFEDRVMRVIRLRRPDDALESWAVGLWRAAVSSAGFATVVGVVGLVWVLTVDPGIGRASHPVFRSEGPQGAGDEVAWVLIEDLEAGDLR